MDVYTHLDMEDKRQAIGDLPELGVSGNDIAYKKLTKTSGFDGIQASLIGNGKSTDKSDTDIHTNTPNPCKRGTLGIKKASLSLIDNKALTNEVEGTRTLNLRIDSPWLGP